MRGSPRARFSKRFDLPEETVCAGPEKRLPAEQTREEIGPREPEYVTRAQLRLRAEEARESRRLRRNVVIYLMWIYALLLTATFGLVYLQGFHVAGFQLNPIFFERLAWAVITETVALVVFVLKAVAR